MVARKIAVLPGDGIGPEIVGQAVKVLEALKSLGFDCELEKAPVGLAGLRAAGKPLPDSTFKLAQEADAVIFGAVGDPSYEHIDKKMYPDYAITGLRLGLGLFVSLRQISIDASSAPMSPMKHERVAGTDLIIVRELGGDVYFGQPKGHRQCPEGVFVGQREGYDMMRYAEGEVSRVAKVAFETARRRGGRLVSADKANVLETSRLWRTVLNERGAWYPDVQLTHQYVDNVAMQLVSDPRHFDVIVTGNLFGDILSDVASALTGSIGLSASAMLAENGKGFYEPGHGTAFDISGRDVANPIASIRTVGLMLRHSFNEQALADRLEAAIQQTLLNGIRTVDIVGPCMNPVGTQAMGDAIVKQLLEVAG